MGFRTQAVVGLEVVGDLVFPGSVLSIQPVVLQQKSRAVRSYPFTGLKGF